MCNIIYDISIKYPLLLLEFYIFLKYIQCELKLYDHVSIKLSILSIKRILFLHVKDGCILHATNIDMSKFESRQDSVWITMTVTGQSIRRRGTIDWPTAGPYPPPPQLTRPRSDTTMETNNDHDVDQGFSTFFHPRTPLV